MKLRINRTQVRNKLGRNPWIPGAHLSKAGSLRSFSHCRKKRLQARPETRTSFGEME
jgi:hypothetical protein